MRTLVLVCQDEEGSTSAETAMKSVIAVFGLCVLYVLGREVAEWWNAQGPWTLFFTTGAIGSLLGGAIILAWAYFESTNRRDRSLAAVKAEAELGQAVLKFLVVVFFSCLILGMVAAKLESTHFQNPLSDILKIR